MATQMIRSILIANRGEIVSRVIRTCQNMGISTVAVFSDADRDAPFVGEADTALYLGASAPSESYLNQARIIELAQQARVDAIHPGYGFLSENAGFARACAEAGIIFIGPRPEAIEAMGSKAEAKALMDSVDVPVIPGYSGEDASLETLTREAERIGYPVLLKATAGGGGKGMRIVHDPASLETQWEAARREAQSAFGDPRMLLEKYIERGRHIEFQILGDQHGQAFHLLERECSIQRRYQKVLEESPSPVLDDTLRQAMGEAALKAARALQYDNAGTVEFIFDDNTREFYFLEVNTRLQVEHPVTEEITGLDLVQLQIEVAEGRKLALQQDAIDSRGYALELRLYAEDAAADYRPATGTIHFWKAPEIPGFRLETSVQSGSEVSIYYDPMIAKLIVWDENRTSAHRKMHYVLSNLKCLGLTHNQDFLRDLLIIPEINQGQYDTRFLERKPPESWMFKPSPVQAFRACVAITLMNWQARQDQRKLLKSLPNAWTNNKQPQHELSYVLGTDTFTLRYTSHGTQAFTFTWEDKNYEVVLRDVADSEVSFLWEGQQQSFTVFAQDLLYYVHSAETGNLHITEKERFPRKMVEKPKGSLEAPMPSQILQVLVSPGDAVKTGTPLLIISSMKMENTVEADMDGHIEEIYVQAGQNVEAGYLLLKIQE